LKIDSWPQAIVIAVGLVVTVGLVMFLVNAGWSAEAIIGFATLAIGLFASQFVQTRKAATVEAKTDQQTETLAKIVEQTNGKSEAELDEIADRAAVKIIAAYKRGDLK
jgi:hypothetical protein